ncbi:MAG: methyl-accepting chemotaxis protein [Psychrosphaera sp.]|nr:methyl-accepting chemotaxis protein [Psychrosphaera sp.]
MNKLLQMLSINQKMVLNMLMIVGGMLVMLSLLFYQSTELGNLSKKVQLAEKLNIGMLMLRRNEKDFLARKDLKYIDKFNKNYQVLMVTADSYQQMSSDVQQISNFKRFPKDYHDKFIALSEMQKQVGLHPKDGLYGTLRDAVHAIEAGIKSQNEYRMLANILQLRRREKDFMLRFDTKYVDKFKADLAILDKSLTQSSIDSSVKQQISASLDDYQQKFLALVDGMSKIGLTPKTGLLGELREAISDAEGLLNTMVTNTETHVEESIDVIKFMALFVSLGVGAVVCLINFVSSRSILRPIKNVSAKIGQIRSRNDLTLRADEQGNDELSTMAGYFNSLMEDFQQLVAEVNSALSTLDHAASNLSQNASDTQQQMGHQLVETDMVATAVTEMGATIDEIAKNTERAASMSNETNANAKDGYQEVMETTNSINDLSTQLGEAGSEVQALEQDVKNIGSVMDVIRGIAEQTNLLALNAAIEAARAGEQGRGFAVVADEVRNLAMRTQESTQEIEQIIQTLQSRTNNVVELMQQCRTKGDTSVHQAQKAGDLLMRITEDVTAISDMSIQIASAIEEQSMVASEVNQNIVKIRDIADTSNNNAGSISDVSNEVSNQATVLVNAVSKFKV